MDTRREFIRKAAMLSGGLGLINALPASVQKAFMIDPAPGSTYLDAEHVVILMQENRSFDHCYGSLRGVRGFNDPRTITLPDKNPVWLQSNAQGETYAPFRLNIKDTNATWMSSLPHSWENQVDARNEGKYDKWLDAKPSGNPDYAAMPLTLGYYNRQDIPFYYALADAFTVCDQNFCSSLTGTTPNRLYFWTGTIRNEPNSSSKACVKNEDVDLYNEVSWKSFPERLEENNIPWKIYQNEISLPTGFTEEEDSWLANFTDNPIEWFSQYNCRFAENYRKNVPVLIKNLSAEISDLKTELKSISPADEKAGDIQRSIAHKEQLLQFVSEGQDKWTSENFDKLSAYQKNLHQRAFTINKNDPHYRKLTTLKYNDGAVKREVKIPKGDILHQLRNDVKSGELPAVSWIVAPANFSDHPGAPWYGAWYISEVMDILTQNPEVWKKTIFILAYDENDGYFDHVPPFVAPHPGKPETGLVSAGINTDTEQVTIEQELKRKRKFPERDSRSGPIGLGFRVPLVIASPWTRGGAVCSEVFDHTSTLQFLEKFLNEKFKKNIRETNISAWRRTVCGDLTAAFKPYNGENIAAPSIPDKNSFIESVHKAKFKKNPSGYKKLSKKEIEEIKQNATATSLLPKQEKGIRPACAIPYELYADGNVDDEKKNFCIRLTAGNKVFGEKSSGSPFHVYTPFQDKAPRCYAVAAGDTLPDNWNLDSFTNKHFHFQVYGPNGFFREFKGTKNDPLTVACNYETAAAQNNRLTGNIELRIKNTDTQKHIIEIKDNAYKKGTQVKELEPGAELRIVLRLTENHNWYDCSVRIKGDEQFEKRYAGHVETGIESRSDPFMGREIS